MDKKSLLVFFLLTCMGIMFAGNVTVISPNGGENLEMGKPFTIKWTASGTTNPFKITLWKNNRLIGKIKEAPAGNGTLTTGWTIGTLEGGRSFIPGPGFKVKVKEKLTPASDISDRTFGIISKSTNISKKRGNVKLPDLVLDRIDQCRRTGNGGVFFRVWVKNIGDRDVTDYNDKFQVKATNTDRRGKCAGNIIRYKSNTQVGILKVGQMLPFDFTFPKTSAAVCIYLDSENTLVEKNENNNYTKYYLTNCK